MAKALTVCPRDLCPKKPWGKGKVKRVISTGGGIIFKGSGFYTTDYRSEKYKAAAKKDAGTTSVSSSTDTKKESKAAPFGNPATTASPSSTASASPSSSSKKD
jgi:predicted nucleic acid-binding Zn ribbon protein